MYSSFGNDDDPYYSLSSFFALCGVALVYSFWSNLYIRCTHRLLGVQNRPIGSSSNTICSIERKLPVDVFTNQNEKIAIVTGSNTGIGFETAKSLVIDYGYTVIMACRSREKAEAAVARINQLHQQKQQQLEDTGRSVRVGGGGGKAIFVHPLDLSSFESVRKFSQVIRQLYGSKIQLLINNAGTNLINDVSNDGLDLAFQSNMLGHFLLSYELFNNCKRNDGDDTTVDVGKSSTTATATSSLHDNTDTECDGNTVRVPRIINLGSVMHHFCHIPQATIMKLLNTAATTTSDRSTTTTSTTSNNNNHNYLQSVQFWKTVAVGNGPIAKSSYCLSKLACILFSIELNRRYKPMNDNNNQRRGIRSIAVNPGAV
jgi:NAD(P)-dependent dehydrogenase (short-subunit alcohol dehydrogenase family)